MCFFVFAGRDDGSALFAFFAGRHPADRLGAVKVSIRVQPFTVPYRSRVYCAFVLVPGFSFRHCFHFVDESWLRLRHGDHVRYLSCVVIQLGGDRLMVIKTHACALSRPAWRVIWANSTECSGPCGRYFGPSPSIIRSRWMVFSPRMPTDLVLTETRRL